MFALCLLILLLLFLVLCRYMNLLPSNHLSLSSRSSPIHSFCVPSPSSNLLFFHVVACSPPERCLPVFVYALTYLCSDMCIELQTFSVFL